MATPVGQIEKKTQERVPALLSQRMGYTDLGDWIDRSGNSNIEPELLKGWRAGREPGKVTASALNLLDKTAGSLDKAGDAAWAVTHAQYRVRLATQP